MCRRPENKSPAKKHLRGAVPEEKFLAHCGRGKRHAVVAVFEFKQENSD
jgi:hypothetical protein